MTLYGKSGRFYDFLGPKILLIKFKTFYDSVENLFVSKTLGLVMQTWSEMRMYSYIIHETYEVIHKTILV